jgi:hypothetical protein
VDPNRETLSQVTFDEETELPIVVEGIWSGESLRVSGSVNATGRSNRAGRRAGLVDKG